jgi:hypothetical protein
MISNNVMRSSVQEQHLLNPFVKLSGGSKAGSLLVVAGSALLAFSGLCGYAWYRTGAAELALQYMGGRRVFLSPTNVTLDSQNSIAEIKVEFLNLNDNSFSVIGARVSCSCLSVGELPVHVAKNERVAIVVIFSGPVLGRAQNQTIDFLIESEGESSSLRLTLSVTKPIG